MFAKVKTLDVKKISILSKCETYMKSESPIVMYQFSQFLTNFTDTLLVYSCPTSMTDLAWKKPQDFKTLKDGQYFDIRQTTESAFSLLK